MNENGFVTLFDRPVGAGITMLHPETTSDMIAVANAIFEALGSGETSTFVFGVDADRDGFVDSMFVASRNALAQGEFAHLLDLVDVDGVGTGEALIKLETGSQIVGDTTGLVIEDTAEMLSTFGVLSLSGVHSVDDNFVPQFNVVGKNGYGTFTITEDGRWAYTADNQQSAVQSLGPDDTLIDSFEVVTTNGASLEVTVTLKGAVGYVVDGYLSGATVFRDANGDGLLTSGEVSIATDALGRYDPDDLPGVGNFVSSGGVDLLTGLPFIGKLTAPEASNIISPLTTLVQSLLNISSNLTTAEAEALVRETLNLGEGDLLSDDPVLLAENGRTQQFAAAAQIANIIALTEAAGGDAGSVLSVVAQSLLDNESNNSTVDQLEDYDILKNSFENSGLSTELSDALANAVQNANAAITENSNSIDGIALVQTVVFGQVAQSFQGGSDVSNIDVDRLMGETQQFKPTLNSFPNEISEAIRETGITFSGQGRDGTEIVVTFGEVTKVTSVVSGAWSITFEADEFPSEDATTLRVVARAIIESDGQQKVVTSSPQIVSFVFTTSTADNQISTPVGNMLFLTALEADGLSVTGAGDVVITDLNGSDADLLGIDVSGDISFDLGSADASLGAAFSLAGTTYAVSSDGARTLDITAVGALPEGAGFVVGADATLRLTSAQADSLSVSGAGNVVITDLNGSDADLLGIDVSGDISFDLGSADASLGAAFSFARTTYAVSSDGARTLDITAVGTLPGGAGFVVGADATLRLTSAQADSLSVSGAGSIIVDGFEATTNLEGFDEGLEITGVVTANNVNLRNNLSVERLDTIEMVGNDLMLTGDQASGRSITAPPNFSLWLKDLSSTADLSRVSDNIFFRVLLSRDSDVSNAVDVSAVREYFLFGQTIIIAASSLYQVGNQPTIAAGGEAFHHAYMDWSTASTGSEVVVTGVQNNTNLSSFLVTNYGDPNLTVRVDENNTIDLSSNNTLGAVTGFEIGMGATLTIRAGQVSGDTATGDGSIVVSELNGSEADLSDIKPLGGVTLALGAADASLGAAFSLAGTTYAVSSDGARTLDITAVNALPEGAGFVVGADVTLRLTAAQADSLSVSGAGSVVITDLNGSDADLFGIDVSGDITFDLGSADASLGAAFSLAGTTYAVSSDGARTLDITAVNALPEGAGFVVGADVTLRLTAAQADSLSVSGAGSVVITDLNGSDADLFGIDVSGDITFDLGSADASLESGFSFDAKNYDVIGAGTLDLSQITQPLGIVTGFTVSGGSVLALSAGQLTQLGLDSIAGAGTLYVVASSDGGVLDASDASITSVILAGGTGVDTFVFDDGVSIENFDTSADKLDVSSITKSILREDLTLTLALGGSVTTTTTETAFVVSGSVPSGNTENRYFILGDLPTSGEYQFGWSVEMLSNLQTFLQYQVNGPVGGNLSNTLFFQTFGGNVDRSGSFVVNFSEQEDALVFRLQSRANGSPQEIEFALEILQAPEIPVIFEDVQVSSMNGNVVFDLVGNSLTLFGTDSGEVNSDWFIFL